MRRALLVLLASCVDASEPSWQLRHERVLAVQTTPAGIAEGETALIDGLLSHEDGSLTEEQPVAVAVLSPHELFTAVHYNVDHWQIDGVHVDTATPLEIEMRFARGEVATKQVVLGAHVDNRVPPSAPAPPALHGNVALPDGSWYTDCGTIDDATWRIDSACEGTLVGVVRSAPSVAWTIASVHVP